MTKIFKQFTNKLIYPIIFYYLTHPLVLFKNRLTVLTLFFNKFTGKDVNFNEKTVSMITIDIVLCAIKKDYPVLIHAIKSVRKFIKHPIGNIYIISPVSEEIVKIAKKNKCILIDENKILPITKKDIDYTVRGLDRSGWLFQQLLKWSADQFVKNEHFLITDADTVYCRPQVFIDNNKVLLPVSGQLCHLPYFSAIKRLTGYEVKPILNVTIHHSLFEKTKLCRIKDIIEKKCKKPWFRAIIDNIDHKEGASVSDYETYGQIALLKFKNDFKLEYAFNRGYRRNQLNSIETIQNKSLSRYKNISFHSYDN